MTDSPDTHRSALAERLREARKAAGLSQGQVAKVLQMHRPTVSEIEAGNRRVSAEELTRFAETYDVTVSWLLGETADQLEMNDPRLQLADSQSCNCGSWHARYGLRQRHDEIIEALAEAGHPLSNDNGNLTLNALQELVDEAARLRSENERLRGALDNILARTHDGSSYRMAQDIYQTAIDALVPTAPPAR